MVAVNGRVMTPTCWTVSTFMSNMGGSLVGNLNTSLCLLSLTAAVAEVKQNLLSISCLSYRYVQGVPKKGE